MKLKNGEIVTPDDKQTVSGINLHTYHGDKAKKILAEIPEFRTLCFTLEMMAKSAPITKNEGRVVCRSFGSPKFEYCASWWWGFDENSKREGISDNGIMLAVASVKKEAHRSLAQVMVLPTSTTPVINPRRINSPIGSN